MSIRHDLSSDGLIYRYLTEDGLPGGEATFALCSFWTADNLALAGVDEPGARFGRLCGYSNEVGLLAEEIDPLSGDLLSPGFTHLALIRSSLHIATAEGAEGGPGEPERAGRTFRLRPSARWAIEQKRRPYLPQEPYVSRTRPRGIGSAARAG